jgi:predicted GNAT superfamily acetyltransferase
MAEGYFLRTRRLGLREWREADLHLALGLWGDPEVTRLIGGPFSRDQVRERLAREMASSLQYWPLFDLQSGEFVGCCGVRPKQEGMPELGFHIRRVHWGRGYAREAARAVIRHAFDALGAQALFAGHNPANTVSRALLGKLGFEYAHDEHFAATGLMHPSYRLRRHVLRDAVAADFESVVKLNLESERFVSPMNAARLEKLHAWAAYHRVMQTDGGVAAFLLGFREGAAYDSPNYRWFAQRYERFFYIDRVIVGDPHRGRGLAAMLYDDAFAFAAHSGVGTIACEFDVDPPNPVSEKFHRQFGFAQVGVNAYNNKQVAMQALCLDA